MFTSSLKSDMAVASQKFMAQKLTSNLLPPQQLLSTDGEVGFFPSIVSNPFSLLIDLACAVALLLFFLNAIPGRKVLALNLMLNDNLILPVPSLADL